MKRILFFILTSIPTYQQAVTVTSQISDSFVQKAEEIFTTEAPHYAACMHAIPGIQNSRLKDILTLMFTAHIMQKCAIQEIKKTEPTSQQSPLTPHWRGSVPREYYDTEMIPDLAGIFTMQAKNLVESKAVLFICKKYTALFFRTLSKEKRKILSRKIAQLIQSENVIRTE